MVDKVRFGYIGRISPEKGLDLILETLFNFKYEFEFEIIIAGSIENSYAKNLKSLYKRDDIKWVGWVDHKNIGNFFKTIDCLLVISNCIENGPLTMYEALYYKKPMIITNTPNIKNIIYDNINGVLTKFNDLEDLNFNIIKMYNFLKANHNFNYDIFQVKSCSDYSDEILRVYRSYIND